MLFKEEQLIDYCDKENKRIYDIVLEDEVKRSGRTKEEILNDIYAIIDVMEESSQAYLNKEGTTTMNLVRGYSKKLEDFSNSGKALIGPGLVHLMAMAFSTIETNAAMGKIVAAPTAGASGIIPAILMYYKQTHPEVTKEQLAHAILTGTGVGLIIGKYATFAGAEGGCQAECGSAAAIGAGVLVELQGGTIKEIFNAASIALLNIMGLVCDPIGGIVEFPCGFRNASGAMNSFISADMSMAGAFSVVPFDQVAIAMGEVGRALPNTLRETGLGGVAISPVGCRINEEFKKKIQAGQ